MKIHILIIGFLFMLTSVHTQTPYFSKKIDFGGNELRNFMYDVSDGLLLYSSTGKLLYKLDTVGNLIWKRKIPSKLITTDIDTRHDSVFITIFRYNDNWKAEPNQDLSLQICNTKGDSVNTFHFGDNKKYDAEYRMVPSKDGGFIFAGKRRDNDPNEKLIGFDSLILFKSNSQGKVVWEKKILFPDSFPTKNYKIDRIYDLGNDNYAFLCQANIVGKKKYDSDQLFSFYVKFNSAGDIEMPAYLLKDGNEDFFNLVPTKAGGLAGEVTIFHDAHVGTRPGQFLVLDKGLNVIKKGTKIGEDRSRISFLTWTREQPNGKFIAVGINEKHGAYGKKEDSLYHGGPWIVCYNKDGIMEWERVIIDHRYRRGQDEAGKFWDFKRFSNGDFMLTGDFLRAPLLPPTETFDLWLVRVDSMGCPFPNCKGQLQMITNNKTDNEEVSGELEGIKIMPNPTTGSLWFEIPDDLLQQVVTIQCFDLSGRNVYQRDFIATQAVFNIDIGDLSNGLYFVRIQDKNGRGCAKKILKQD